MPALALGVSKGEGQQGKAVVWAVVLWKQEGGKAVRWQCLTRAPV